MMLTASRLFIGFALISAATLVFSGQARADGLTLTLDTTNLTTVEGSGVCSVSNGGCASLVVNFTVTNNTGSSQTIRYYGGNAVFVSGDSTDSFLRAFLNFDNCRTAPLANGASCNASITYVTAPDTGETDGDFALEQASFGISSTCAPGTCVTYDLTINDAPATQVPEPSSLLLLGSGLVGLTGLAGATRRRFFRSPLISDRSTA